MKRGAPLKRKPPPPKTAFQRAWEEPHFGPCRVCGHPDVLLRHHVVYRQKLRAEHKPQWNMWNALDVGWNCDCHELHHNGSEPIRLVMLSVENLEHAFKMLGPYADLYLRSRYVGYDSRLAALLADALT